MIRQQLQGIKQRDDDDCESTAGLSQVSSSQEREEHGKRCFRFHTITSTTTKRFAQGDKEMASICVQNSRSSYQTKLHCRTGHLNYRSKVRPFFCVLVYCKLPLCQAFVQTTEHHDSKHILLPP